MHHLSYSILIIIFFLGLVIDGPYDTLELDLDYQADIHTATVRFTGFDSSMHGIVSFDWAIGTTAEGEDVKPYFEHGLIYDESPDIKGNGKEG